MKKRAVCLLIVREDGQILAVTRRGTTDQWGLPGGKVEPDESVMDAAERELLEETGLIIMSADPIFGADCGEDYHSICFEVTDFDGELETVEDILVAYQPIENLIEGPFGDYNRALFASLGMTL